MAELARDNISSFYYTLLTVFFKIKKETAAIVVFVINSSVGCRFEIPTIKTSTRKYVLKNVDNLSVCIIIHYCCNRQPTYKIINKCLQNRSIKSSK